ncbi:MAG: hypothetical protein M1834_005704 [Cirrosporium novae-zelandiae]|nr:MAG: hypothetical protein M1834_005704 [Cirrosporium novae-zelandiae]
MGRKHRDAQKANTESAVMNAYWNTQNESNLDMQINTPHKSTGEQSYADKPSTQLSNQPETSPYLSQPISLLIGPTHVPYHVLKDFLYQSPILADACKFNAWTIELSDVDEDLGHTVVHYLYTGTYQTLKSRDASGDATSRNNTEYKRSIRLYYVARTYSLRGLELLAKNNIIRLEKGVPISEFLDAAEDVFPRLPRREVWFVEYLKKRINEAFEEDETLFTTQVFLGRFGKVGRFDKVLAQIVIETYSKRIERMAGKAENVVGEVPNEVASISDAATTKPESEMVEDNSVPLQEPVNDELQQVYSPPSIREKSMGNKIKSSEIPPLSVFSAEFIPKTREPSRIEDEDNKPIANLSSPSLISKATPIEEQSPKESLSENGLTSPPQLLLDPKLQLTKLLEDDLVFDKPLETHSLPKGPESPPQNKQISEKDSSENVIPYQSPTAPGSEVTLFEVPASFIESKPLRAPSRSSITVSLPEPTTLPSKKKKAKKQQRSNEQPPGRNHYQQQPIPKNSRNFIGQWGSPASPTVRMPPFRQQQQHQQHQQQQQQQKQQQKPPQPSPWTNRGTFVPAQKSPKPRTPKNGGFSKDPRSWNAALDNCQAQIAAKMSS